MCQSTCPDHGQPCIVDKFHMWHHAPHGSHDCYWTTQPKFVPPVVGT